MNVYDLHDDEGRDFAFEIANSIIGRRGVCRVVSRIPGVTLLRRPLTFLSWFRESTFCEFELEGVRFSADEGPWGDSSRYWIGPEPPRSVPQLQLVRRAFVDYMPLRDPRVVIPYVVVLGVLL
jgi:hypothetical protein